MSFKPIQRLDVSRRLSTGEMISVGELAQNRQGVFFQYNDAYLDNFSSLSPFTLPFTGALHNAPKAPHNGLHGLFSDSLPDGWGHLLQDRIFRQHNLLPSQVTGMDRLAFVGSRSMGALTFSPESDYQTSNNEDIDLSRLGLEAQALFDGQTEEVLSALVAAGSSGGARPKAQVFFPSESLNSCRTQAHLGDEAWLVKFTSQNLALGHEEGLCEAAYLTLASKAKLKPPCWKLLDAPTKSGAHAWLAVKRFDWVDNGLDNPAGRRHMHSACGLLDADYRAPSLDYEDLIKASRQLCKSPAVGQLQFRRAIFNLFASNQDDHSKNWAFLQDDHGVWSPAPFYDVTFSPHPFNEHATSFCGHGHQPPLKTMQKLASSAGFANWKQAQIAIHEILDAISGFAQTAKELGVKASTIGEIESVLAARRQENSELLKG